MKRTITFILIYAFVLTAFVSGQERVDQKALADIKTEGFQRSQAMETIGYLADVFGPRLTNSMNLKNAKVWMRDKMTAFGLENARIEPWGKWGEGWDIDRFSMEMTAPTYDRLISFPLAWSPGTNGAISGSPILVSIRTPADFANYRGKLKGAIVMNGRFGRPTIASRSGDPMKRLSEKELAGMAASIDPSGSASYQDEERGWVASLAAGAEITKFFKDEGVAALLKPSSRPNGVLAAQGNYEPDVTKNVPTFVVSREQYARMMRLIDRKVPVKVELSLSVHTNSDGTGSNVIAEIPGTDPKLNDEIVLLGGHFDSWHSGTGAADNGAGCVAVVEALRILKAIGVKPRRTIRVALWDGEEQDYYGSMGYVKEHFGDPFTIKLKPEQAKVSAYYNLDNGSGRIRGIYLQGNEAARSIFAAYLQPFAYLDASTLSTLNTGGTDHMSFDAVGIPGFQFIQDPLDYESRIHHTNLDVLESVSEEDMKVNAVVLAFVAYETAMRDEMMPRKELPKPAESTRSKAAGAY